MSCSASSSRAEESLNRGEGAAAAEEDATNSSDYSAFSGCSKWRMRNVTHEDLSRTEVLAKVLLNVLVQCTVWSGRRRGMLLAMLLRAPRAFVRAVRP